MTDIAALQSEILAAVAGAADEAALEAVRVAALGKKGSVSELLNTLGGMTPGRAQGAGARSSTACAMRSTEAIAARKTAAGRCGAGCAAGSGDASTSPCRARPEHSGTVHPISQVLEEITAIFADLGFAVAEGPDIEFDDYNFTKLNIPPDHPARQMQDTFYVAPQADGASHVLRTHTSPVQVRTMLKQQAAHPHHLAGPHLSRGLRRHPFADVPPGRSAGDRRRHHSGPSEMDGGGILQGVLRDRHRSSCARGPVFFPFTEPSRGMGHALRPLRAGQDQLRHRQ